MKKYIYISLSLMLTACGVSNDDKSELETLNLTSIALSTCLSTSAERFGYESISDVETLSCSDVSEEAFDQTALDEMNLFENLSNLSLYYMKSPIHFDGSNFPALKAFRCDNCSLESIDLSQNSELNSFEIWGNTYLTELDLSNSPKLEKLNLSKVTIMNLNLGNQQLLKEAYIVGDALYKNTQLNINLTGATALESLEMFFVGIEHLDLSNNLELTSLQINYSTIQSLDIGSTKIQHLGINYSDIVSLDTSTFIDLRSLVLVENKIVSLNLENNVLLELLNLKGNPLSDGMLDYLESITWIDRIEF
ncbi:hypothetical protein CMT41_02720 [Colwellia sp. MT41]|uniref:Internalin-J n=1 Tax=Colwellia marinimaniae TaxID=1513592 RepID=A0ABQ0MU21_9GAMM|nr:MULTISPECIES: hypothetical protein [Colwellia]ALO33746.1 hypothetical protein CMT41_02720 [Colwellia sp. MT41]GAW95844.1 hypothetical protein MTCD1_01447 [Colwellia marinimaniae]